MCLASTKVEDRPHRGTIVLDGDIQRGTRAEHLLLRAGSGICFGIQERLRNLGIVEHGGPQSGVQEWCSGGPGLSKVVFGLQKLCSGHEK